MWKLTIIQKRKSEYSDNTLTERIEFVSDEVDELIVLLVKMTGTKTAMETEYKLEKVEKEGEEDESV